MMHVPEVFRIRDGRLRTDASHGCNGAFRVRLTNGEILNVVATDREGWEHVSVSRGDRIPRWDEMCIIKALFWDPEDVVVQYHPRESEYVNMHPRTLHLWRQVGAEFATPPAYMVGWKLRA
jgi:hypothetical protein